MIGDNSKNHRHLAQLTSLPRQILHPHQNKDLEFHEHPPMKKTKTSEV